MFVFGAATGGFSFGVIFDSAEFFALFSRFEFSSVFRAALAFLLNFFFGGGILFFIEKRSLVCDSAFSVNRLKRFDKIYFTLSFVILKELFPSILRAI